jgi:hypothetical protein
MSACAPSSRSAVSCSMLQHRRALALSEVEHQRRGHLEADYFLVGQPAPHTAGGDFQKISGLNTREVFWLLIITNIPQSCDTIVPGGQNTLSIGAKCSAPKPANMNGENGELFARDIP